MNTRLTFSIPALALSALSLAACSAGSASTSSTPTSASAPSAAPTADPATPIGTSATASTSDSGSSSAATAAGETATVAATITGGHETNSVDGGRPVVLVASLLGVEPEVFREAFSGVTPAKGGESPQDAQVQLNKQALLSVLGPYGVTNDALDEASNAYRYSSARGEVWAQADASAIATVVDGVVTGITVTNAGRGYSSPPTITVRLPDGTTVSATATVTYTGDFATNGSLTGITLNT